MSHVRTNRPYPLLALLALALQACAFDPFGPDGARGDLREARERWALQGIRDYRYTVANHCFCGRENVGPVRVEVRGGQTVSVTPVDPAVGIRRETFERLDTVEELFATVERAIDRDPDDLDASYHPGLGYPVRLYADYDHGTADEESGFEVRDFERIP